MDNLLVRDYDDLTMEERARSIEEARRLGWECAQADDGLGPTELNPRDYTLYIVEPAYAADACSEADYKRWQKAGGAELMADPRVQAFLRAWAEEKKKIKEEW